MQRETVAKRTSSVATGPKNTLLNIVMGAQNDSKRYNMQRTPTKEKGRRLVAIDMSCGR